MSDRPVPQPLPEPVTVEIDTKIRINDPDQGGATDIKIRADGTLDVDQGSDNLILTKDASIALAKVILQRHQVAFEPIYQQEVVYL